MDLSAAEVAECVDRALAEDLGPRGDRTSALCVPTGRAAVARVLARQTGIVAGLPLAEAAFRARDPEVELVRCADEGADVEIGDEILSIRGLAAALLSAERTALNFVQRLSGIATLTRRFVDVVDGTGARILDTRKTTPGLRLLEKYAVRVGGGQNHRVGLFDQVLIKENHFACALPEPFEAVVRRAVEAEASGAPVIVEARDVDEAVAAVRGGAGVVLLDNFEPGQALELAVDSVRREAAALGQPIEVEVSGGIRVDNARSFAQCGVDRISVGALTHSAPAFDLSLLVETPG